MDPLSKASHHACLRLIDGMTDVLIEPAPEMVGDDPGGFDFPDLAPVRPTTARRGPDSRVATPATTTRVNLPGTMATIGGTVDPAVIGSVPSEP